MKNFLEKLKLWWEFEGKYLHRDFIEGIKNLIKWFPIIWKDRNWDHSYIYEILKFKLKNQAEYIGVNDRHTRAKEDSETILKCVDLIDKVQSEFYSSEYMDYHKSNFEFIDIEGNKEGMKKLKITEISENFDEYFKKYPDIYDYVLSNKEAQIFPINEKKNIAINIAEENHKRAKKELFQIIEDNIEKWWD